MPIKFLEKKMTLFTFYTGRKNEKKVRPREGVGFSISARSVHWVNFHEGHFSSKREKKNLKGISEYTGFFSGFFDCEKKVGSSPLPAQLYLLQRNFGVRRRRMAEKKVA